MTDVKKQAMTMAITILVILCATACGQKGNLYLPETVKQDSASAVVVTPNAESTQEPVVVEE